MNSNIDFDSKQIKGVFFDHQAGLITGRDGVGRIVITSMKDTDLRPGEDEADFVLRHNGCVGAVDYLASVTP